MALTSRFALIGFVVVSAAAVACGGQETEAPPATTETQASSQPNTPTTVTGCLRAGDAADTFVLTTSQTSDASRAATYELAGQTAVNLQDHVGRRIQVTGIVESQSQIATREAARPADNATGTAGTPGTPTVQTGTQLNVRRLNVTSVRAAEGECPM